MGQRILLVEDDKKLEEKDLEVLLMEIEEQYCGLRQNWRKVPHDH